MLNTTLKRWQAAEVDQARHLPHEYLHGLLNDGVTDDPNRPGHPGCGLRLGVT